MNPPEAVDPGAEPPEPEDALAVGLRIPAARRFHAAGRLVTGGFAARLELDVDRLEDLRLAMETILQQPPAGETLELTMSQSDGSLVLDVGPFAGGAPDPSRLEAVLGVLVDDVDVRRAGQRAWVTVRVEPSSSARGGR
jgi:serine/threonine-protein kinase RsbW